MERTDSSSAMMLLQYGDSDEETTIIESEDQTKAEPEKPKAVEKKSPEKKHRHSSGREAEHLSPNRRISEDSFGRMSTGLISDEEVDHHLPDWFRKRPYEEDEEDGVGVLGGVSTKIRLMDVRIAPPVSPVDVDSGTSLPNSQRSQGGRKGGKREPAITLVSYATDDLEDDDDDSESDQDDVDSDRQEEDTPNEEPSASPGPRGPVTEADDIQLPPEPPGRCSKALQEKLQDLCNRMKQKGVDTNYEIQRLTSFRNPSIYDKLVQMHHINEKGSNFKLDVFNPKMWGKDSFYDELDKLQKKDMERREREKKTKIEFMSGTKKAAPSSDHSHSSSGNLEDKKRKSKWDALPPGLPSHQSLHRSGSGSSITTAPLTTSATGTRATVISAVGTLTKKAPYNVITSSAAAGAGVYK